jgi:hypothetical protein
MERYEKPVLNEAEQARLKVLEVHVPQYFKDHPNSNHISLPPHHEQGDTRAVFSALFASLKEAGFGVKWNADNIEIDVPH